MNIKEIEQELKDIPLELRKLRAAKTDLETEINRLHNEGLGIRGKIVDAKKKQMAEDTKLATIIAEVEKNTQENKKILVQRNKDLAVLMEKESELEGAKAEIAALIDKNRQIEIANIKAEEKLKEANKKLQEDKAQVERQRLKNISDSDQNKTEQAAIDEQSAETQKLNKSLSDKNDDLDKTLEQAKAVKEEYERKLKEVEEEKKAIIAQVSVYKSAEKACNDKEDELETIKEELQDEIAKAKAKQVSFDRMNAELSNREKRIELAELKLQKFARDNNLVKELEDLKKSLEPKV